jgi:hypothetical protein
VTQLTRGIRFPSRERPWFEAEDRFLCGESLLAKRRHCVHKGVLSAIDSMTMSAPGPSRVALYDKLSKFLNDILVEVVSGAIAIAGGVLSVIAFHEKAGGSQEDSGSIGVPGFFADEVLPDRVSHCRHASIRTLEERIVSLGACWAFSIQPVLPSV